MDVHEGTATVREAMRFSAYLRQPASVPISEKDDYVEEVRYPLRSIQIILFRSTQIIELLELQDLADALVSSLSGWLFLSDRDQLRICFRRRKPQTAHHRYR